MALYFGNDKRKICLDGIDYSAKLFSEVDIIDGIMMLSSEGSILKDSTGAYLTVKKGE